MSKYFLTAFSKSGEHLINEVLEADNDSEAKKKGIQRLREENMLDHPSRLAKSSGGLVHFHQ